MTNRYHERQLLQSCSGGNIII